MIKEYWNLIGREPFLAITWELDFSQACSFCRMLTNHKNFHFTQIPDKTNDAIFLKSPKTMFWAIFHHFWSFLTNGDFFQKIRLCSCIWAPNTMLSKFQKKLISQSQENLQTDGKMDERTKGRTDRPYFIGPFQLRLGVQQISCKIANWSINSFGQTVPDILNDGYH